MIVFIGAHAELALACAPSLRSEGRLVGLCRAPDERARTAYDEVHEIDYQHPAEGLRALLQVTDERLTVVNFAARKIDKLFVDVTPQDVDETLDINVRLNFSILPPLVRRMIAAKWGRIVFIASAGAAQGDVGISLYAATKATLAGLTRSLAKEYGQFGITANVLSLGHYDHGMYRALPQVARASLKNRIPSRQLGQGEDVAEGIRFLIRSRYVNGAVIPIDGGL